MSKHLELDLERLQRAVLAMATAVEEAIRTATRALCRRDPTGANAVIVGDAMVDRFENEVQDECLKILALHQPVAGDLRRVSAVILISTDLERMGDLAVAIANRALVLVGSPGFRVPARLDDLTALVVRMVRQSLDSFVQTDAALARAVIRADDAVDAGHDELIKQIVADMKQSPELIEPGLSLFSAVRHLERIADHATNIAEDVVYLVEGELVRHMPGQRG